MYFLRVLLGVEARFDHFYSSSGPRIQHFLDNEPDDHPVIVTRGNVSRMLSELGADASVLVDMKDSFLPQFESRSGYLPFSIEKHAGTDAEIDAILAALGQTRTPQIDTFVNLWPTISQNTPGPNLDALLASITDAHRMRISYP